MLKGYSKSISEVWLENQITPLPSRMEGQALALIEAMWCQRAAIVTDVGGAVELIEDEKSGFVASATTVEATDEALERAWNHRAEWRQLGFNASISLQEKYPADAADYFNQKIVEILEAFE